MFYTSINIPDVDSYILSFSYNAENARVWWTTLGQKNSWMYGGTFWTKNVRASAVEQ